MQKLLFARLATGPRAVVKIVCRPIFWSAFCFDRTHSTNQFSSTSDDIKPSKSQTQFIYSPNMYKLAVMGTGGVGKVRQSKRQFNFSSPFSPFPSLENRLPQLSNIPQTTLLSPTTPPSRTLIANKFPLTTVTQSASRFSTPPVRTNTTPFVTLGVAGAMPLS